jgi:hypothetical protein
VAGDPLLGALGLVQILPLSLAPSALRPLRIFYQPETKLVFPCWLSPFPCILDPTGFQGVSAKNPPAITVKRSFLASVFRTYPYAGISLNFLSKSHCQNQPVAAHIP